MTVTQVGSNQQVVYVGQPNGSTQTVYQNTQSNQPIPVGQPYQVGQQVVNGQVANGQVVPVGQPYQTGQQVATTGNVTYPIYYPNNPVNNIPQSQYTYDNDIMMSGINFDQLAKDMGMVQDVTVPQQQYPQSQQQVVEQYPQQTVNQPANTTQQPLAFTGNPFQAPQQANDGLTNCLVTPEEAAKAGAEKKFKLGPAIGTAVGFAAPFVCNKARLGKFLTKDLLLKAPVMSAGGLCAGGIAEGLVASAKKLEANNAEAELVSAQMDAKA